MLNRSNPFYKNNLRQYFHFGIILIFSFFLMACGDSGSSSSGGDTGLAYTGLETAALITNDNAEQLSANSLSIGANTSAFSSIAALEDSSAMGTSNPAMLPSVSMVIADAARQIDTTSAAASADASTAVIRETDTISGDCAEGASGSASYSIQVDDENGTFTGTLEFNDYCVDYTRIDGSATFSGTVNMQSEELAGFTLSFDELTGTSEDTSMTFDGVIELELTNTAATSSMDMVVRNNITAKTYKVVDYNMTITDSGYERSVEVSGTFYDPDYGYVVLTTTEPLLYEQYAIYPYSGQIVLEGAQGTAGGPTKAQLTAVSATTCRLQVDANGDGDFDDLVDYDSGEMFWEDLGD